MSCSSLKLVYVRAEEPEDRIVHEFSEFDVDAD